MTLNLEGYATITWGQPPEHMARDIETIIGQQRTRSDCYNFRGDPLSLLSDALNEFMDYNESMDNAAMEKYIFNSLLGIDCDRGRLKEPVIVYGDKITSEPRAYMIGPHGHPRGEAVALVRPFRKELNSGNGFFSVYPGSHKLEKHEFEQQRREGKLQAFLLNLRQDEVLIMRGELWVNFPHQKGDGVFVSKGYSCGQGWIDEGEEDVVPFMR